MLKPSQASSMYCVLILLTFAPNAAAYISPNQHHHEAKPQVIRPDISSKTKKFGFHSRQVAPITKYDLINNSIQLLGGQFPKYSPGPNATLKSLHFHALQFIDDHPEIFHINSKDIRLLKEAVLLGNEQFLKFQVYRNNIIIEDANIDFRFKLGTLVQVVNQSFGQAKEADMYIAKLSSAQMQTTLQNKYKNIKPENYKYRVIPKAKENHYELIKVLAFSIQDLENNKLIAQINTKNGEIFEIKNTLYHYQTKVSGKVYKRWYTEENFFTPFPRLAVKTGSKNLYTDHLGLISHQNPQINIDGLSGKNVKVRTLTGRPISINETASTENKKINIKLQSETQSQSPLDLYSAQLMAYYHTDFIATYAKQFIQHPWLNTALLANVNLPQHCNAHWDGRTINFYTGDQKCANTALIADVIYHEWGHGLDAKTGGIADGAFSEGYGDIISMIISRDHKLGIGFRLPNHEPVRDLEPDKIYPDDRGEVHAEGLIIGSTFWDLFKAIRDEYNEDDAAHILANYAFKMIFTARTYLDVYDALLVIDDDDEDLSNGTPHLCILNRVFKAHGLAEEDSRCKLAALGDLTIKDDDNDAIIEPGESIHLQIQAKNLSPETLGELTGTLKLPAEIEITNSITTWPTLDPQAEASNIEPFSFNIPNDAPCGKSYLGSILLQYNSLRVHTPFTFVLGKNLGQAQTYQANNLPLEIKDHSTAIAKIPVNSWQEDTEVYRAHLKFHINHTYRGDLEINLRSPSQKIFPIYRGKGSKDDVDYSQNISELISGSKGNGVWELLIKDDGSRDEGHLNRADLELTPKLFVCD